MKKTSILLFAILIGVLSVSSCVQPLESGFQEDNNTHQLELKVSCLSPATKAFENYPDGENDLNENRIDHVDWFIFRDTVGTDATPWASNRVVFSGDDEIEDGTTEFMVTKMGMDKYLATHSDGKGYVLAIANYPSDDHSVFQTDDGEPLTFSQIREMQVVTSELGALANGKFTALNDFLMTSYATPFTLSEGATVTVNAKLSRLAAKISLNISIVPYIDEMRAHVSGLDTNWVEYIQTWYPNVEGIRAYMTYANERTSLTPVTDQTDKELIADYNDDDFFTYNSRGFVIDPVTTTGDGTSIVTGSPFYSYPMKWETSDPHAPFIKIILQWTGYKEPNSPITSTFISHETGGTHPGNDVKVTEHEKNGELVTKSQNFYYKISIPSKENILQSNVWTKINLDVAVLGGVDEDNTVNVVGRYFVVDWNDPAVTGGGELASGKYLSLATDRDIFYIYGGNSIEIPVLSSHDLEVVNSTATYYDYSTATPTTKTLAYSETSFSGDNYTIAASGRSSVTLKHELESDLSKVEGRDISTITYTFRIKHSNNASTLYKDVTVIQYPSLYIETVTPGNAFLDGRGQGTADPSYGYLSYDNAATTIYHVHITAFNGDSRYYTPYRESQPDEPYEYLITDPRVNAGWGTGDLLAYGPANGTKTNWPSAVVTNMKVATSTPNFIAPSFLVSSRYGRPGNSSNQLTSLEIAEKRCATYQEAGYPAGRWRLPTEAEVYFLFTLQTHGLITRLYSTGSNTYGYWASSGYVFGRYWTSGTPDFRTIGSNDPASVRCVYDTWYWGNDPVTPITEYHPGPTI